MLDTFFFFFVREVEVGLCFVKNTEVFLVLFLCQVYKATGEEFLKIAGGQIPVFFFPFFPFLYISTLFVLKCDEALSVWFLSVLMALAFVRDKHKPSTSVEEQF